MKPWQTLAETVAPDGTPFELRRRGHEYLILVDGLDLMSNLDQPSSRSLAELGCLHLDRSTSARVLVGGLGMGFTLRGALDFTGPNTVVEVAELIPAVVEWNQGELAALADHPLDDPRTVVRVEDVQDCIRNAKPGTYDVILLDVDNGPEYLAHEGNQNLYEASGLAESRAALKPGGVLAIWCYDVKNIEDAFTKLVEAQGFESFLHRVEGSRKGRGRYHYIWVLRR